MLYMIQVRNFIQKIRKLRKLRLGMAANESLTSTGGGTSGGAPRRKVAGPSVMLVSSLVCRAACGRLGGWLCVMLMKCGKLCGPAGPSG
jgi:hypothetical protein